MKQFFLLLLLSSFSMFCYSQSDETPSNAIAIFVHSNSTINGGMSIRYMRQIENAGKLNFMLNSNFENFYRWKIGYEILQLRWGRLELGTGIDTKYSYIEFDSSIFEVYTEFALELSLEARLRVFDHWRSITGISRIKRLWTNTVLSSETYPVELRVGLEYEF